MPWVGREVGNAMSRLTVGVVEFIMDSILDGGISRSEACRLVAPHVERFDPDASPLAADGAERIHGFDMGYVSDRNFLSHAKDGEANLKWYFTDSEISESIDRWKQKVRSVREGGPSAWARWLRPTVEISPPEILTGLERVRQEVLPDGRLETYIAFLDGYDRGSGGKLGLDGFPGWLVLTGAGTAKAVRRWFDQILVDEMKRSDRVSEGCDTSSCDEERIEMLRGLLVRYLAEQEMGEMRDGIE